LGDFLTRLVDSSENDPKLIRAIRARLKTDLEPWQEERLVVAMQALLDRWYPEDIAEAHGISRRTVFNLKRTVRKDGVAALLKRGRSTGRPQTLKGTRKQEFEAKLRRGTFESTAHAQLWIEQRTGKALTRRGVGKIINRSREQLDSAKRSG
jgi:transposase